MSTRRVTIVLATYNRPKLLPFVIRSVLRQTFQEWRLLIIGDHCDERTQEAIEAFDDDRIFYVNLPRRCFEQALPNSVGMTVADSEYIAFLNHDDLWLECHLARAVRRLDIGLRHWFIGRAAYARHMVENEDGSVRPIITEMQPKDRDLATAFYSWTAYLEPSSSWVFRRELIDTVGPWRPAVELYRVPLVDWAIRAWRAKVPVHFSAAVSTLCVAFHLEKKSDRYRGGELGYAELEERFRDVTGKDADAMIAMTDLIEAATLGWRPRNTQLSCLNSRDKNNRVMLRNLVTEHTAKVYYLTGWDAFEQYCLLTGLERGSQAKYSLARRTGETIATSAELDELVELARSELARAGW